MDSFLPTSQGSYNVIHEPWNAQCVCVWGGGIVHVNVRVRMLTLVSFLSIVILCSIGTGSVFILELANSAILAHQQVSVTSLSLPIQC